MAGGSARGLGAAVQTNVAQRAQQRAQHRRGVLVVEDRHDGDERALGQRGRERLDAARVVRAVEHAQRALAHDLQAAGNADAPGDRSTSAASSAPSCSRAAAQATAKFVRW